MLTDNSSLACIDLDDCRNSDTGAIDNWAQQFLERAKNTYVEVSVSGCGLHVWGLSNGASKLHRNEALEIGGKQVRVELYRHTAKPLTISSQQLGKVKQLADIDAVINWAGTFVDRHKAAAAD